MIIKEVICSMGVLSLVLGIDSGMAQAAKSSEVTKATTTLT